MAVLERQAQVLDAVRRVVAPLVRLLVSEGVGYQNLIAQLKPVFLEQALAQILAHGEKDTDSALSLRSGIHRKDIAAWRQNPEPSRKAVKRSVPAEVFSRWVNDPAYLEAGQPRPLPRSGPAPSFEALARQVNQDVHPLSVLNELLRLGLVELTLDAQGADQVALRADSYVPQHNWDETLELFVENLRAHLATATQNLRAEQALQLEQAAYAGGLTPESAQALAALSRQLWKRMLQDFLAEARRLHAQDGGQGSQLVRLGVYFHDERLPPEPADAAQSDTPVPSPHP